VKPTFFATPAKFRAWLEAHHDKAPELWVGLYKRSSGRPSITWPEAVDEALCFGWIDGVRKGIDDVSYMNRYTPRRARSTWSTVNVNRVKELKRQGRMHPAGLSAFEKRAPAKSGIYSYEQRHAAAFEAAHLRQFRASKKAWDFFQSRPPGYRQTATWWVVTAKREETRRKRLATLIEDSERGRTLVAITPRRKP
jgi:uncharacterized protein YdeI (YjbR/CyaY-like superfamily)